MKPDPQRTATPRGRGDDAEWSTVDKLAALFGVGKSHFRDSIRLLVDGNAVKRRGPGKAILIHGPTLLRAWRDQGIAVALKASQPASESDPLLTSTGDSPQLERYRAAKADLAELDVAKRQGELADVALLESYLREAMLPLRQACETLQRTFGIGAYEILEAAVVEADKRIQSIRDGTRLNNRGAT